MRVSDLVDKLKQLDQSLELYCLSDSPMQYDGRSYYLLNPVGAAEIDVVGTRGDDGHFSVRFERSELSRRIAVVEMDTDL